MGLVQPRLLDVPLPYCPTPITPFRAVAVVFLGILGGEVAWDCRLVGYYLI
jgi:hypothetical protein